MNLSPFFRGSKGEVDRGSRKELGECHDKVLVEVKTSRLASPGREIRSRTEGKGSSPFESTTTKVTSSSATDLPKLGFQLLVLLHHRGSLSPQFRGDEL